MIFIYIRHGEPIYNPDSLTELGKVQAEDIAEYLSHKTIHQIFSSTSNRAIETALPTARRFNKEITYLDFANEHHVWKNLTTDTEDGKRWLFQSKEMKELFHTQTIIDLGMKWYNHLEFENTSFKFEIHRIQSESDQFFTSLGYQHLGNGKYKVLNDNDDCNVMFAHQGFGLAFLSLLLSIPYPHFCTHFDLGHAEITTIEFKNEGGYSYPKVLSLSNNKHLQRAMLKSL